MKRMFFFLGLLIIISCQRKEKNLTYSEYDFSDSFKKDGIITQNYKFINPNEANLKLAFNGHNVVETVIKEVGSNIYLKCGNKYVLSHSFAPREIMGSCVYYPPFFNKRIKLTGKKIYLKGRKKFTVYSFGESSGGDADVATYYLKDVGFLCYYELLSKKYYFLSDFSGINNLDKSDLDFLRETLVSDTTFFVKYFVDRLPKVEHLK